MFALLFRASAVFCIFLASGASFLHAATLFTRNGTARSGETIAIPVFLSSGGRVLSGLQFDIACDPELSLHIAPGAALAASSKLLIHGTPEPRVRRLIAVGLNRVPMSDGELVQLFVTVAPHTRGFEAQVSLTNAIATSPESAPVPLTASSITVEIQPGAPTQLIPPSAVLNAASLLPGPVAPGEILTLFGSISSPNPVVTVNGYPAQVLYAGNNQINAVAPFEIDPSGTATLEVVQDSSRTVLVLPAAPTNPAIFTFGPSGPLGPSGAGQGAILNQDYSLNAESSPAARGTYVMVFGAGFGATTHGNDVTAAIDGVPAVISYAGPAPGSTPGLTQINVLIPNDLEPNPHAAISFTAGSRSTQQGVTISIR